MKILSIRNVLAVAVVGLIVGVAYITNPALFKASNAEATTSENVSGWAWSENTGWISFNSTNENPTSNSKPYGVNVNTDNKGNSAPQSTTGIISGIAWSTASTTAYDSGIGWISFNRGITGSPNSAWGDPGASITGTPLAYIDWSTGKVYGWARALAGCDNVPADPVATPCLTAGSGAGNASGGWDGWIKLSGNATDGSPYGVKISANKFSGYAWGGGDGPGVAGVVGWIDFAPTVGGIPMGAQISAPPCTVATATSLGTCQALTQCTGSGTATNVPGVQIGLCASGGTVTLGCTIATQQCAAASGSGSGGPVKLKYKQF